LSADASPLEIHQTPAYAGYPVDYKVADFGQSHEIIYTRDNIKNAEAILNHKMVADWDAKKAPVNPRNYKVADFGLDTNIKDSLGDLELEEKIHGAWNIDLKGKKSNGVTDAKKEITRNHLGPYYVESAAPAATIKPKATAPSGPIVRENAIGGSKGAVIGGMGIMGGMSQASEPENLSDVVDSFGTSAGSQI